MAKSATFITLLFAALVLFAALEAPTMVEAQAPKLCQKTSGTWLGFCGNSNACNNQCIRLEGAIRGSCNSVFPETPTMVEAKLCEKPNGTWSGVCANNNACKNQCIRLEGAKHGSCNYVFTVHKSIL